MPTRPPVHQPVPWMSKLGREEAKKQQSASLYHSPEWKKLRKLVLERDQYICQLKLPGCMRRGNIADHIIERKDGGRDTALNLRCACAACHNVRHPRKGGPR